MIIFLIIVLLAIVLYGASGGCKVENHKLGSTMKSASGIKRRICKGCNYSQSAE